VAGSPACRVRNSKVSVRFSAGHSRVFFAELYTAVSVALISALYSREESHICAYKISEIYLKKKSLCGKNRFFAFCTALPESG
jgi:hypothetical protein